MFDIGFWELTLVAVVALVVIGPDRLPGVARALGLWLGKLQRFIAGTKQELTRELERHAADVDPDDPVGLNDVKQMIESSQKELNATVTIAKSNQQSSNEYV